jgi:hypothetical protein
MPQLYRSMQQGNNAKPQVGSTARQLGVRDIDVNVGEDGLVVRDQNGMSLARNNPCNLPPHRRPPTLQCPQQQPGTGADPIWEINSGAVCLGSNNLEYISAPSPVRPEHAVIRPNQAGKTLAQYRQDLANTANYWVSTSLLQLVTLPTTKPVVNLKSQIQEALQASYTFDQLRTLVIGFYMQEHSQEKVYQVMKEIREQVQKEKNNTQEYALIDIMNCVYGFCLQQDKIWPEQIKSLLGARR